MTEIVIWELFVLVDNEGQLAVSLVYCRGRVVYREPRSICTHPAHTWMRYVPVDVHTTQPLSIFVCCMVQKQNLHYALNKTECNASSKGTARNPWKVRILVHSHLQGSLPLLLAAVSLRGYCRAHTSMDETA